MIEEFVIAARGGSWFQSGGRAEGGRDSLAEHLRARPDTLRGFSAAFSADVGGGPEGAGDEHDEGAAQCPLGFTVRGQRFVVVSLLTRVPSPSLPPSLPPSLRKHALCACAQHQDT